FLKLQTFVDPNLGDVETNLLAVVSHLDTSVASSDVAAQQLAAKHSTQIVAVVKIVDLKARRTFSLNLGSRNLVDNRFKEQLEILLWTVGSGSRKTALSTYIEVREEKVILLGAKIDEKIKGLVVCLQRSSPFAVNLVDANHDFQAIIKR